MSIGSTGVCESGLWQSVWVLPVLEKVVGKCVLVMRLKCRGFGKV